MAGSVSPLARLLDLGGRVAIVTGASSGIGGAIALRLAEAGAAVVCHYHSNRAGADTVADSIRVAGGQATVCQADLSTTGGVEILMEGVANLMNPGVDGWAADILVNNAALQPEVMLADMEEFDWTSMLETNVTGPFLLTKAFVARLRGVEKSGAIVNVASIQAHQPAAGHAHYATSKAALLMFTRAAALEFGQFGIRINSVSPGLINRDGLDTAWPEGVGRWRAAAPLGRLGEPGDVADAVLFLVSEAARWITGTDLIVDGGVSARPTW